MTRILEGTFAGRRVRVERNIGHPSSYLWIYVDDRKFFLGVRTAGITVGGIRERVREFVREHPEHFVASQALET